jgi:signal transduction histidine kinase/CheY-like chemotaxis protein/predicted RNA-binding protein with RPS1 domain
MEKQDRIATKLALRYPRGTVIEAQVRLVKSFEAVIELDDSTMGFIRNRELSWEREPEHAREVVQKGQKVKVMVLGIDWVKQRLKLSLRQAERDPWKVIGASYKIGQVVRCKVTGLLRKIAFVELEPAVEGYVPLQEICIAPPDRVDKVIWIGDTVEAAITSFEFGKRRVRLSIKKHLAQLKQDRELAVHQRRYLRSRDEGRAPLIELLSDEDRLALLSFIKERKDARHEASEKPRDANADLAARMKRVLVADDDASFRTSLQYLLKRLGHEVEEVDSAEGAVSLCAESHFDLVLMDLRFKKDGMGGLQAVPQIASIKPELPVLVLTGLVNSNPYESIAAKARAAGAKGILLKPVDLCTLNRQMALIAEGQDWVEPSTDNSEAVTYPSSLLASSPYQMDMQRAISRELMKLQHETQATACILFQMTPNTRIVSVFANTGTPLTGYETNKYTLQSTPIQEVIRQGIEVYEADISHNPQRFKYLNLISYESCIGVPVHSFGQTQYGMFLFHDHKGQLTREHLARARVAAKLIGVIIDRGEIESVVRRAQPLVFAGQIGSMLIHELNNRLGSVLNYAETLLMEHEVIERDVSEAMDPRLRTRIRTCIRNLEDNARAMEKITSLYLGLMSVKSRDAVRVNDVLRRAMSVLAPVAERQHVEIFTELENELPATIAISSWLEQAFVNVALNAIQNINLSQGAGELIVQSRFVNQNGSLSIQILFSDTGPGIHGQHLEHIFDLGFSTRHEGTGLGLFTTRGLIEAMGGKIKVRESVMLVGTIFLIELPLIVPSVEEITI